MKDEQYIRAYNIEQIEATQAYVDDSRNQFISTLSKEDQNKFDVVSKVCQMLTDANIPFFLFPMLPVEQPEKYKEEDKTLLNENVYQYNNVQHFLKFDSVTDKMAVDSYIYHNYFITMFVRTSGQLISNTFTGYPLSMTGNYDIHKTWSIAYYVNLSAEEWIKTRKTPQDLLNKIDKHCK